MTSSPAVRTLQILTTSALGMACLLALLPAAGHDQMWLLYAARLHLHGAPLYGPEIFETNPPLGIWLSAVPEFLARVLHLPDTAVGKLLVCLLALAIPAWCLRVLRRLRPVSPMFPYGSRAGLWWLAFAWVCLAAVAAARDFGQRDHLLALLVVPYLCAAAVRAEGLAVQRTEAVLIGIAAGLGICLKPHHALVPIVVESLLLVWSLTDRTRNSRRVLVVRLETAALVLTGAAFLVSVHLLAPRYFTEVLPLARDTYWAFHQPHFTAILAAAAQLHIFILMDVALALTLGRVPRLVAILLAGGAGATAAYYLQGTGWYYQQLPALTFFGLALAFLLLEIAQTRAGLAVPRFSAYLAAVLGALVLFLTAHFMDYPFTPARSFPIDTPDPAFFADLPPGTPVSTITTTVDYTIAPVFRYDLVLAQRYPHFWLLPAILRNEDPNPSEVRSDGLANLRNPHPISPARLAELDALQHRFMVEDLDRWQPPLLLVERCQDSTVHCQVLEDRHDDLLAWFLRDPAFRARFAHYRYWRSAGPFDAWLRID